MTTTSPNFICLGEVVAVQGIKGQVRIKTYTENPEDLTSYGVLQDEKGTSCEVQIVSVRSANLVIARLSGCNDRNQAETFVGTKLLIAHDQLPVLQDDEFYYDDLIGLQAVDDDQKPIGIVKAVHNYGAGDFLEITTEDSKNFLLPFNKESVPVISLKEKKYVQIDPAFLV